MSFNVSTLEAGISLAAITLGLTLWFAHQLHTAPLLDDNHQAIQPADPTTEPAGAVILQFPPRLRAVEPTDPDGPGGVVVGWPVRVAPSDGGPCGGEFLPGGFLGGAA